MSLIENPSQRTFALIVMFSPSSSALIFEIVARSYHRVFANTLHKYDVRKGLQSRLSWDPLTNPLSRLQKMKYKVDGNGLTTAIKRVADVGDCP
ncbi:hypothetical protein BZA70DRAFT_280520 [Myxozyma melibiosi]|uniref:Uncharacterized protein n=1 Tax=Myxozyma melibiosi TaxID=54550 RepID=A0ABR1F3B3_9ASCO